jgi:hypothetical protein
MSATCIRFIGKRQYSDNAPPRLFRYAETIGRATGFALTRTSRFPRAARLRSCQTAWRNVGGYCCPQIESSGANGNVLLILGTDPADSAASVAYLRLIAGEFSALGGDGHGSQADVRVVYQLELEPVEWSGRNRSMGMGRGTHGGGGRNSGSEGIISLKGSDGGNGRLSDPRPDPVASMVYPLPSLIGVRHNALVAPAGPMGGADWIFMEPCHAERFIRFF